jgi:hypothetical protein
MSQLGTGPAAQIRAQGDPRVVHAQRIQDAGAQHVLVRPAGPEGQRMAQQSHRQVRVFVLRLRLAAELMPGQEGVEIGDRVVGVRVGHVGRLKGVRQPREPGGVGRDVEQGDGAPALRHFHAVGQEPGQRLVERHLAGLRHLGQQRAGEGLGDGPDLEHGAGVEGAGGARLAGPQVPPGAVRFEQSDHEARHDAGGNSCLQHAADGRIVGEPSLCGGGNGQRDRGEKRDEMAVHDRLARSEDC